MGLPRSAWKTKAPRKAATMRAGTLTPCRRAKTVMGNGCAKPKAVRQPG